MANPDGKPLWGDTCENDDGTVDIRLALATDNGVDDKDLFETIGHEIGHFCRSPDFPPDEEDSDMMEAYAEHYEKFTADVFALFEMARREFPYPRGDKIPWGWRVEYLLKEMAEEHPESQPQLVEIANQVREVMRLQGSRLPMHFGE